MNTDGQEPTAGQELEAITPQQTEATNSDLFPRDYVEKLRQEAADYRTKLRQFEEQQQKAEEERLAKSSQWQELAEKRAQELAALTPIKERYEAMLTALAESNKKRIDQVPEHLRSLVPEYDDPARVAAWLDANWQALTDKPIAPNLNGGTGNGTQRAKVITLTDAEIATAQKMGIKPEDYQKYKVR